MNHVLNDILEKRSATPMSLQDFLDKLAKFPVTMRIRDKLFEYQNGIYIIFKVLSSI
jgi:hypothetical protein